MRIFKKNLIPRKKYEPQERMRERQRSSRVYYTMNSLEFSGYQPLAYPFDGQESDSVCVAKFKYCFSLADVTSPNVFR